MRFAVPATLLAVLAPAIVLAQSCPQETKDQIQTCLDTVIADEGKAPCSSSDWACICNVQEGLLACPQPCPELIKFEDLQYNNNNCNGQNGYTNEQAAKAAGQSGGEPYRGSSLTTSVASGSGSGGATPTAPNPSTSASATSTAESTTSAAASTSTSAAPTSSASRSSGTTAPSSTNSSGASNAAAASLDVRSLVLPFGVVSALVFGSGLAVVGGLF